MTAAQAVSRMKAGRGLGQQGSWRSCWLGSQGELRSEDEQRCHGPAQPQGLQESEKQDLECWLAMAHTCSCQHVGVGVGLDLLGGITHTRRRF